MHTCHKKGTTVLPPSVPFPWDPSQQLHQNVIWSRVISWCVCGGSSCWARILQALLHSKDCHVGWLKQPRNGGNGSIYIIRNHVAAIWTFDFTLKNEINIKLSVEYPELETKLLGVYQAFLRATGNAGKWEGVDFTYWLITRELN